MVCLIPSQEPSAEERLSGLYQAVYRRALYLTGNRSTAEDAAQETFFRYLSRRPAGLNSPLAWLITVCTRICVDWSRQQQPVHLHDDQVARLADTGLLPDEVIAGQEELHLTRLALASLEHRDRTILLMRYASAPYREIAAAIGCADNSVGQMLHRAERRFKTAYEHLVAHGTPR